MINPTRNCWLTCVVLVYSFFCCISTIDNSTQYLIHKNGTDGQNNTCDDTPCQSWDYTIQFVSSGDSLSLLGDVTTVANKEFIDTSGSYLFFGVMENNTVFVSLLNDSTTLFQTKDLTMLNLAFNLENSADDSTLILMNQSSDNSSYGSLTLVGIDIENAVNVNGSAMVAQIFTRNSDVVLIDVSFDRIENFVCVETLDCQDLFISGVNFTNGTSNIMFAGQDIETVSVFSFDFSSLLSLNNFLFFLFFLFFPFFSSLC